jgi:hypothetical protein
LTRPGGWRSLGGWEKFVRRFSLFGERVKRGTSKLIP